MEKIKRNCNHCQKEYLADPRNIKRGWGLACSKSCAAHLREKSKPGYDPKRVQSNNVRRELWNVNGTDDSTGRVRGHTSEGYRIIGDTAYDEFDDPVYTIDPFEDDFDHGQA